MRRVGERNLCQKTGTLLDLTKLPTLATEDEDLATADEDYAKPMNLPLDPAMMLQTALAEARAGLAEGGIPIGAAIFSNSGVLVSAGHNRRVQQQDPSIHGETDAFRRAGRQRSYRDLIMVTTLAPCWYCSGLVRQFGFRTVIVGESETFSGGIDWLRAAGIDVVDLASPECIEIMEKFIAAQPTLWNEDIGVD